MPAIILRRKRVVVDIDTQKHFFTNNGTVCVLGHRRILANILRVINWARLKEVPIISTVQIFPRKYPYCNSRIIDIDRPAKIDYTLRPRRTSFDAEDRADLLPEILDRYDQVIFYKRCLDPFEEPRADKMLSGLQADEFILVGALTEGAVKATALGLLARRKKVTVLVDATGSYDRAAGKVSFRLMQERGAHLTNTRTLLCSSCVPAARPCKQTDVSA
ncbi:MAG: cysteine hydrolase family protein [Planctomycetota bacterium]|jgi:nicotinamidase-related amidase